MSSLFQLPSKSGATLKVLQLAVDNQDVELIKYITAQLKEEFSPEEFPSFKEISQKPSPSNSSKRANKEANEALSAPESKKKKNRNKKSSTSELTKASEKPSAPIMITANVALTSPQPEKPELPSQDGQVGEQPSASSSPKEMIDQLSNSVAPKSLVDISAPFIQPQESEPSNQSTNDSGLSAFDIAIIQQANELLRNKNEIRERNNGSNRKNQKSSDRINTAPNWALTERKEPKSNNQGKREILSKEELEHRLSSLNIDSDLKETALGVLDGERITNSRDETQFFYNILKEQAKATGSNVNVSTHGSHKPIKLTKKSGTTVHGFTNVRRHGRDPNGGSSLSVQQAKLRQMFTPLQPQEKKDS
jgi:hypothetical protein